MHTVLTVFISSALINWLRHRLYSVMVSVNTTSVPSAICLCWLPPLPHAYTLHSLHWVIKIKFQKGPAKSRNPRNPPKFTKSSVYIKQIPRSATKSSYIKW